MNKLILITEALNYGEKKSETVLEQHMYGIDIENILNYKHKNRKLYHYLLIINSNLIKPNYNRV